MQAAVLGRGVCLHPRAAFPRSGSGVQEQPGRFARPKDLVRSSDLRPSLDNMNLFGSVDKKTMSVSRGGSVEREACADVSSLCLSAPRTPVSR